MIRNAFIFSSSVILQILTLALLPSTKGFTNLWPTVGAIACIAVAMGLFARMIESGVQLSVLSPLSATIVPLCLIAVGILLYGETAPALKILLLITSCILVGVAATLK